METRQPSSRYLSISELEKLRKVFLELDDSFQLDWRKTDKSSANLDASSFSNFLTYSEKVESITDEVDADNLKHPALTFEKFVEKLQLGAIKNIDSCEWTHYFLMKNGLVNLILSKKEYDRKLSNHLVKFHDIIANAFQGNIQSEYLLPNNIVKRVMTSILFCHLIVHLNEGNNKTNVERRYTFLAPTIATAMTNYNSSNYDEIIKKYIFALHKLCSNSCDGKRTFINCSQLISSLNSTGKEGFFKMILKHSENSQMVYDIVGGEPTKVSSDIFVKLLLSRTSFGDTNTYKKLICFLSRISMQKKKEDTFFGSVLIKVMQAWSDPIIAKAHVSAEIIHYTQLIFVLFYHLVNNRPILQKYQQKIVEHIAKGLPNHLNSTDFRTISLAKFLCDMITESLKFYAGREKGDRLNEEFLNSYLDDSLCCDVLGSYQKDCCEAASKFWTSKYPISSKYKTEKELSRKTELLSDQKSKESVDSDDDEDDDLKPIESLDVPQHKATKIVYIRDFLEKLPELKTYDETAEVLKVLPNVIKHQLIYDHGQVGQDILDAVFRWENDFDQPILDEYRKSNLCTILKTRTEGNVEHFCKYFHGESYLQPYKKNIILDVLSTVSKDIPLKQLGILANSAFSYIMYDENCVKTQDVTVKIPLILFFSNLLCNTLPRVMVKEDMVISYLRCLTQIEGESVATEQAARYAIHSLVGTLEGFQFSDNVQSSISDTRTWLCRLQNAKINSL